MMNGDSTDLGSEGRYYVKFVPLYDEYRKKRANIVNIRIPEVSSAYGSSVLIKVTIDVSSDRKSSPGKQKVLLLETCVDWVLTEPERSRRPKATSVMQLRAWADTQAYPLSSIHSMSHDDVTQIFLSTDELVQVKRKLIVSFVTPDVYVLLPENPPYVRTVMDIDVRIKHGNERTILYLDYPQAISFRARRDEAEYMSLSYSADPALIRKIGLFPESRLKLRYLWGSSNREDLNAPAMPLYPYGLSLILMGYALALAQKGQSELAAAMFAASFFPPFLRIEEWIKRTPGAFSQDVKRTSYNTKVLLGTTVVYGLMAVFTALTNLSGLKSYIRVIAWANFLLGILFWALFVLYLLLVHWGVLLKYECDRGEHKIWFRTRSHVIPDTRQTVCNACWRQYQYGYTRPGLRPKPRSNDAKTRSH